MIRLHRLNGQEIVVNAELIESVMSLGKETVIAMATNNRIVVSESVTDVIEHTVEYRRHVGVTYMPQPLRRSTRESEGTPCP